MIATTQTPMDTERLMAQNGRSRRTTAYVETYGCQMNVSDGELMQGILAGRGYDLVASPEEADVVLVNTCAIREHAERRVLGRVAELNRLKKDRPDLVIGVTGCMAQRMGEELLERAPYVDLVMGPDGYRGLPEALGRLRPDALPEGAEGAGPRTRASASPAASGSAKGPARGDGDADGGGPAAAGAGERSTHFAPYRVTGRRGSLPVLQGGRTGESNGGRVVERASVGRTAAVSGDRIASLDFQPHENYEGLEVRRESRISAWVPVQRGCNYRCTYCIVPYVRGPEKNRHPGRILDEVRGVAEQGIPEVTLLGQTVNSYWHGDWDFARLLRAVSRVDGIRRVRFTSPHPNDVTDRLVEAMAEEPAVCRQLHLPVQSGHDRTLKRMLRRYTVESYLEKVALVRQAIPEIALSTDVIVAFPGETDEEYEATLDLMREVRFDDAFMYKYSPREGTPATRLPGDEFIDPGTAQDRLERLIDVQRGIQAEINRAAVGGTVQVLVEREARSEGDVLGRTERNKVVAFPGDPSLIGRFLHVRLTHTTGATFTGERVEEPVLATTR
ncbi:MAG: MiaB/RimO family radical SAM methylthiotransferase [Gemmatimonadota bacterium]